MVDQYLFSGSLFGGVFLLTWWIGRSTLRRDDDDRLRQRLRAGGMESQSAGGPSTAELLTRIGEVAAMPFMPAAREKQSALRKQLGYAGLYTPAAMRLMIGCKLLLLIGGVAGGYLAGMMIGQALLGISIGGLLGYLLPQLWLRRQIGIHQKDLVRGLPDALDLLVVCVEAGLTVDAALQRVALELSLAHPRLAKELEITHMETRVGLARSDALRNLAQRTGNPALQTLSSMLIQAERFGTSIAQSLRIHAESMRVARQHAAEEQAAKASVKLSFPVVLFIFPAVLIVLAGPAVIGLMKSALFAD